MASNDKKVPIQTLHLFPVLDRMLIALLSSLSEADWNTPTIARRWTVKEVAAHLLDGNLKGLSTSRDQFTGASAHNIHSYADLVSYINSQNHLWTDAARRLSPQVMLDLLEVTGRQYSTHLSTLDPWGQAIYAVSWAGHEVSPNWFHIAREYTEKLLHQQQIRDAVDQPGLMTKELFYPFINTFMQGLPHTFRAVNAPYDTIVTVIIPGDIGGQWSIIKGATGWAMVSPPSSQTAQATLIIKPELAWKLYSKSKTPDEVLGEVECLGNQDLAMEALKMVSVMA